MCFSWNTGCSAQALGKMKSVSIRLLTLFLLAVSSFQSFAEKDSEYGDIIRDTHEYKRITTPKAGDGDDDHHHHHYPVYPPVYYPAYPPPRDYYRPARSSGGGLPGAIYLGVTIGDSEFDYNDIEDGDASIFRIGYRPRESHLGYEFSFFDSGDAEVTSLADIDIEVDTINLALTFNSASDPRSRFNLFAQGGIYFADTTLSGPFDSVSENSNGFLLGAGVELMLNRHFGLRAEALQFFDVEDFANDESITTLNLGGLLVF